ncbi:MAG: hypothetical protein ACXVNM_11520 [Bacteroidia bacterium]
MIREKLSILFLLIFPFFPGQGMLAQANDTSAHTRQELPSSWDNRSKIVSLGFGMPNIDPLLFEDNAPLAEKTVTITDVSSEAVIHCKLEFAVSHHWGLGLMINRSIWNYTETAKSNYYNRPGYTIASVKYKVVTFNIRANYHFLFSKFADPYIGVGLGIRNIAKESSAGETKLFEYNTPFGFEATVGIRILMASLIGFYMETGVGRSLLQAGISFNLGGIN